MISASHTTRKSEGYASARRLLDHTSRAQMPQPLLLTPATNSKAPQLRLIKPPRAGLSCGYGTCSLTPECTGTCRYSQADNALRSHYNGRHTQRQAMPGGQQSSTGPRDENGPLRYVSRRHEWKILGGLLALFLVALALPIVTYVLTR